MALHTTQTRVLPVGISAWLLVASCALTACGAPTVSSGQTGDGSEETDGTTTQSGPPATGKGPATPATTGAVPVTKGPIDHTGGGGGTTGGSTPGTPNTCTPDTFANFARPFFVDRCAACHGAYQFYDSVRADTAIQARINNNSMPPGAPVSQAERTRLDTWYRCGLPQ